MIIVFGSAILDLFFELDALPQADTAVHLPMHRIAAGGKGANQALASLRAGAEVSFYGAVGDDLHGKWLRNELSSAGLDVSHLRRTSQPTGLATVFVDCRDGTHRVVVSQGANSLARQSAITDGDLSTATTLVIQGELATEENELILRRAKAAGLKTVLNFAPVCRLTLDALRDIDVLVVNEHEALEFARQYRLDSKSISGIVCCAHRQFGMTTVVTLGARGVIFNCGESLFQANALKVKTVDTLGAGDAFTGFLAASLDSGFGVEEAVRRASVAGALTCTDFGAQSAQPLLATVLARLPEVEICEAG